jgi:hypothetical protein
MLLEEISWKHTLILFFHPRLCLSLLLFLPDFTIKYLYVFLISHILDYAPSHPVSSGYDCRSHLGWRINIMKFHHLLLSSGSYFSSFTEYIYTVFSQNINFIIQKLLKLVFNVKLIIMERWVSQCWIEQSGM